MRGIALALLLFCAHASAQQEPPQHDVSYREVRPPEGSPRRGLIPVPPWAPWLAAAVLSTAAALILVRQARGRR